MPPVPVYAFLDFASPACYIADAALGRLEAEGRVEVRPRALELFPAPEPLPAWDPDEWAEAEAPARAEALPLRRPALRPRTAKAHETVRFAAEHGRATAMRAAIFGALFRDGRDIGRIDVLTELAGEVGLDPPLTRVTLDVDRFSAAVKRESAEARRIGIRNVPALVLGGGAEARLLQGTQSYDSLAAAVDALSDR